MNEQPMMMVSRFFRKMRLKLSHNGFLSFVTFVMLWWGGTGGYSYIQYFTMPSALDGNIDDWKSLSVFNGRNSGNLK